jgi:hypothetical protein
MIPSPTSRASSRSTNRSRSYPSRATAASGGDDDTLWVPGSLSRAVELLDESPKVGALVAHVAVGPDLDDDPICAELASSPCRAAEGAPGPGLLGMLAGASVVRRDAFSEVGGFDVMLVVDGQEELLSPICAPPLAGLLRRRAQGAASAGAVVRSPPTPRPPSGPCAAPAIAMSERRREGA